MSRRRAVGPVMIAPTHSNPEGEACFVATECAIHTITLAEGSFTAIVQSKQGKTGGVSIIGILDHDEVEDHIRLLRNAIEDAKLIDQGLEPIDRTKPVEAAPGGRKRSWDAGTDLRHRLEARGVKLDASDRIAINQAFLDFANGAAS